jgi:hypothetical protein
MMSLADIDVLAQEIMLYGALFQAEVVASSLLPLQWFYLAWVGHKRPILHISTSGGRLGACVGRENWMAVCQAMGAKYPVCATSEGAKCEAARLIVSKNLGVVPPHKGNAHRGSRNSRKLEVTDD